MVLSNEPGYYREGEYGIRTENLVAVRASEQEGWLHFETLTLFPIDRALIVKDMLAGPQVQWVDAYHQSVLDGVGSLVAGAELDWLRKACGEL